MEHRDKRKKVAKYMRRLYKNGLTTCSGGNVSMKDEDGNVFITASQTDKSKIKWNKIAVINKDEKIITQGLKPSMEFSMHLEIYKKRPDIFAIVHAHPVYVSTFSVTKTKLDSNINGEARFILGDIAYIDYELMGSEKLANSCAEQLLVSNVGIMRNHGAICIGKNLFEAYDRMEVLEYTARIRFNTLLLNNCEKLKTEQIIAIDKLK